MLVDLTTAEVTDLTDQLADGLYVTGELRPDEAVALIGGQDVELRRAHRRPGGRGADR